MPFTHTPGPWSYKDAVLRNADGHSIASGGNNRVVTGPILTASLRLAAAAPELLSILERILGAHDTKNNGAYMGEAVLCHYYAEVARAAIAKARGE